MTCTAIALLASCGSEFTAAGDTSTDASIGVGGDGVAGSQAGSSMGPGGNDDASATGGAAGASSGGGGAGMGGSGMVDASPLPAGCTTDLDCDDKNICSGKELCREGKCIPGAAMACAAGNNLCVTVACDPVKGCVGINNTNDCTDGNMCTIGDKCNGGTCKPGAPKPCTGNMVCDPASGACRCPPNTIVCNNTCVPYVCCPGATAGPCGRCGILRCNDPGTALSCQNQHGTCDPGWVCSGACTCPGGGDCSCPGTLRRECDANCNITGCF